MAPSTRREFQDRQGFRAAGHEEARRLLRVEA
jgi:hypothetical protein